MATLESPDGLKDEEEGKAQESATTVEVGGAVVGEVSVWSLSDKKYEDVYVLAGSEGKHFVRGKREDIKAEQDREEEVQQGQAEQGSQEEEPK